MIKHLNITVTGRVQGVYFRGSTQRIASGYNIKGFAKNMPDGTVYIEAEGSQENLNKFLGWCHKGPDSAHVDKVDYSEGEIVPFTGFGIRYS